MDYKIVKDVLVNLHAELKHNDSKKSELFRKRTGKEILDSGFFTGCSDFAIATKYLLEKRGIKTKFIDVLRKSSGHGLDGHVFLKAEKVYIDPLNCQMIFCESFLKRWSWVSVCDKLIGLKELKKINQDL